jgi:membrane-bound lytic murein transglycosylase A
MDLRTRNRSLANSLCLAALIVIAGCMPRDTPSDLPEALPVPPVAGAGELQLTHTQFSNLANWSGTIANEAFVAFARSCNAIMAIPEEAPLGGAGYGGTAGDWSEVCESAGSISPEDSEATRNFFETGFAPYWVTEGSNNEGLFTGYFEPELRGSTTQQGAYQTPLHGIPDDLVSINLGLFRDNLMDQRLAGRLEEGRLVPYDARAEIMRNGLDQAEELLYVDDPVDAFFLAIQGSGRVRLEDGSVVRAAYAGQNGHPYTAIGAVLIRQGELTREEVSMQSIRAWLDANPDRAQALLDQNASYIFFSVEPLDDAGLGAKGTQGVPLTAQASIAVDASAHPLGIPIWLETTAPMGSENETEFHRLLIAQDTGGAINGALRGDIYWGVGQAAGEIAGRMRSTGTITVFLPSIIADRIGRTFPAAEAEPSIEQGP